MCFIVAVEDDACKVMPRLGLCKRGHHRPSDQHVREGFPDISWSLPSVGLHVYSVSFMVVASNPLQGNWSATGVSVALHRVGIFVGPHRVGEVQQEQEPDGVAQRRRGWLRRRAYHSLVVQITYYMLNVSCNVSDITYYELHFPFYQSFVILVAILFHHFSL